MRRLKRLSKRPNYFSQEQMICLQKVQICSMLYLKNERELDLTAELGLFKLLIRRCSKDLEMKISERVQYRRKWEANYSKFTYQSMISFQKVPNKNSALCVQGLKLELISSNAIKATYCSSKFDIISFKVLPSIPYNSGATGGCDFIKEQRIHTKLYCRLLIFSFYSPNFSFSDAINRGQTSRKSASMSSSLSISEYR